MKTSENIINNTIWEVGSAMFAYLNMYWNTSSKEGTCGNSFGGQTFILSGSLLL